MGKRNHYEKAFQAWLDAIDELNRKISLMGNVPQQSVAQGDAARALINLGETTGNQGIFDQGLKMLNEWLGAGIDATTLAGLETERDAQLAAINETKVQAMVPKVEVYVSGTGGLDEHRQRDNPSGEPAMPDLVVDEIGFADTTQQRIMHDLHEPDQTGHE